MQATFITLNNKEGSNSMKYLVTGSEGPGFASPMETAEVLENIILPTFDTLVKLEGDMNHADLGTTHIMPTP